MSIGATNGELPKEGEMKFFTFDSGNANLDNYYRDLLFAGPVGSWVDARIGKFGERVLPKHMYVTNWGTPEKHHVAWVYHEGLIETDALEGYMSHHVVCDCAVDVEESALPMEMLDCPELEHALTDRAEFWSREYLIPQVLGALSIEEADEGDPGLSISGQELLLSSMLGFLELERRHPQKWFGNRVSGMMSPGTLATLMGRPHQEVAEFVEILSEGGLVDYDGDTVKYKPKTPIIKPAKTTSFSYASYDEAMGITKRERAKRQMRGLSRRLQRKILNRRLY